MSEKRIFISCGILRKEIILLIERNSWELKSVFLNSSLHVDFGKLMSALGSQLTKYDGDEIVVCYGTCHPLIDKRIEAAGGIRIPVQNCVELLLGKELFTTKLEDGAFFLFEDWAKNWDEVTESIFGSDPENIKEIFTFSHKYLLALRTECSDDFDADAEKISRITGLPLQWYDSGLEILEKNLKIVLEVRSV
jgi:hypothetical protein